MYEELVKRLRDISSSDSNIKSNYIGLTMIQAADAIEELQKALNAVNDAHNEGYDVGYWAGRRDYEPKWIPVTEQLPEKSGDYIIFDGEDVLGAYYEKEWKCDNWTDPVEMYAAYHATHWMPLPAPPKEGSK